MNSEIEQLKRRVETLEAIVRNYSLMQEFQPLKLTAVALKQSEFKIRQTVKAARLNPRNHPAKTGIHYNFNGNQILINVVAWNRDINSTPLEKI
jgi:predicted DsbA family dithiol-disulfide isomerase